MSWTTPSYQEIKMDIANNTAEFGRVKGLMLGNWTVPVRRTRSRGEE